MIATAAAAPAFGPAAPFVLAGSLLAPVAIKAIKQIGKGRRAATKWTTGKDGQDAFLRDVLGPASKLSATDPDGARSMVESGWKEYLSNADAFARKGGTEAKVIKQNLSTPDFMNTVKTLLGKDPLGTEYTGAYNMAPSVKSVTDIFTGGGAANGGIGNILASVLSGAGGGYEKRYPMDEKLPSKTAPTGGGPFGLPGGTPPIVASPGGGGGDDNPFKGSGVATAIGVGGNILSGILGARAAGKAQDAQVKAAEQQQKNLQPWVDAGKGALTDIESMLKDPKYSWDKEFVAPNPEDTLKNPAVKFQLEQGKKLLEASASARGAILSGPQFEAIDEYGQGVASQEYDKLYSRARGEYETAYNIFSGERNARLNPLQNLAGIGQTATTQLNTAQGEIGDAQAAGAIGGSNQWKSAIDNITKQLMDASMIYRQSSYNPEEARA